MEIVVSGTNSRGSTQEPWLLRVEEVAELLSISRSQVYVLLDQGGLPSVRIGQRCRRIPADQLRAWLAQQTA